MAKENERFEILVSDKLEEEGLKKLRTRNEVVVNPQLTPDELISIISNYDALVVRSRTKVTSAVIEAGIRLKVIGRAGVGVDNIDVKTAVNKDIIIVNSPLAATRAVAELTIGLMFALSREIPQANTSLKQNKWEKSRFMGTELYGKTLGIIGIGRIGTETARIASALDMKVLAYHKSLSSEQVRKRFAESVTFEELLENSDFISLHLPITPETRGIIGVDQFSIMKKGAHLICTARGGIINENALRIALDSDRVASAALDVFHTEPPQTDSIATHPKVIATPHIGAMTKEAQIRASISIAEEVNNALSGEPLRWQVN